MVRETEKMLTLSTQDQISHLIEKVQFGLTDSPTEAPPGTSPLGPAALRRGGTAPSFRRGAASRSGELSSPYLIAKNEP